MRLYLENKIFLTGTHREAIIIRKQYVAPKLTLLNAMDIEQSPGESGDGGHIAQHSGAS